MISALPIIFVTDIDAAIDFYRVFGFEPDTKNGDRFGHAGRVGSAEVSPVGDTAAPNGRSPDLLLRVGASPSVRSVHG